MMSPPTHPVPFLHPRGWLHLAHGAWASTCKSLGGNEQSDPGGAPRPTAARTPRTSGQGCSRGVREALLTPPLLSPGRVVSS